MKTALVTGATSGIGLCIANELHRQGIRIYGTSRDPEKHKSHLPFELLELDILDPGSIRRCIDQVLAKSSTLDILVNNAGIGVCGSAEETGIDLAQKQFQANFWGAVNMTRAVLPQMREQKGGQIITVGSLAGIIGVPFQSYYSASKHALEGFYKSLRMELRPFSIRVSVIEPGFFKTNLHHTFEYPPPVISDYDTTRKGALEKLNRSINDAPAPDAIAATVMKIIRSGRPRFSYRVGKNTTLAPWLQFMSYRLCEEAISRNFGL